MTSKVPITIDNVSPLIQYDGNWLTGSVTIDPYHDQYSDDGTFTVTQSNQAFATINFKGTGIDVFGAKRPNHNLYSMSLDGKTYTMDGYSQDETFHQTLFSATNLTNGQHTLIIRDASNTTDASQSYFDIDWVVIDTVVDGAKNVHLQDTDGAFQYDGLWNTFPPQVGEFSGQDGHSTVSQNASVTLRFTGTAVDVYGLVCSACGEYEVALDGGPRGTLSAYNDFWTKPQTLLYMARGLDEGAHVVTLTNRGQGNAGANSLSVDYAIIYGHSPAGISSGRNNASSISTSRGSAPGAASADPAPTSTDTSSQSQTRDGDSSSSSVPVGAIVGAVLGGLSLVILGLALVLYVLRKRRPSKTTDHYPHAMSSSGGDSISGVAYSHISPAPIVQTVQPQPTVHPFPLAPPSESFPAIMSTTSSETVAETLPGYYAGSVRDLPRQKR